MKVSSKLALFLLLAASPTFAAHRKLACTTSNGFILCGGHVASNAEVSTLLPPGYQSPAPVERTTSGKIKRSGSARQRFLSEVPCPATGQTGDKCRGYVIDHITPLACGGADDPSNMQFQSIADGKEKDKWERVGCGK